MKRFIIPLIILAAGLFATTANAQVYVHARIPIPLPPVPRFLPAPPAPIVEGYPQDYVQEQPYYAPAPAPVVVETPGAYYGGGYGRRYYDRYPAYRDVHYGRGWFRHEDRGHFFERGRGYHRHW